MAERIEVDWDDLGDLELDSDNPRHEPGMARRDIITYLIGNESVFGLAKDIKEQGLSPLDNWGALRDEQGGYVVVEGNRRLAALMLLHDPSLAPAKERKAFERLSRDFNPASLPDGLTIPLVILKTRAEADKWIERKHNGQAGGIGPRSWTATQQARFFGEKTGNQLALALLEYAVERGIITKAQSARAITTVTRFVSTPFVRRHGLGIVTSASTAEFKLQGTQTLFEARLRQFITDIVNRRNGATSRAGSADRAKYAQDHLVPIADPGDSGAANGSGGEGGTSGTDGGTGTGSGAAGGADGGETDGGGSEAADGGAEGATASGTGGSTTHPNNRALLVPQDFAPSFRDERLKRILLELKTARKASPLAAALLVRVFIESITVCYLETRGATIGSNDKLHIIVHNVLKRIETDKKAGTLVLTKAENGALALLMSQVGQPAYVYSAAYLGYVAHGSAFPEWSTLTSKWDEIAPILLHIAVNAEPAIKPE